MAVSPDGDSVYVPNLDDFNVSQYDVGAGGALTPKTPATVAAGTVPRGVAVSPDGGSVYVVSQNDDNVRQYDVGTDGALTPKTPATVAAGGTPSAIAVSPAPRKFDVIAELGASASPQCLSQDYTLQPGTEYGVRLCARDAGHTRWNCGGNRTFTTAPL